MLDFISISDLTTFVILIGLELVLGIDNVLLLSILSGALPKEQQSLARNTGLGLALIIRIFLVVGATYLFKMTEVVLWGFSYKSILLLGGGAFLIFKSSKEIYQTVECNEEYKKTQSLVKGVFWTTLQIVLLDIIFSVDSVVTAVGLTSKLGVIEAAVVCSFILVMFFSKHVSEFIQTYTGIKILALLFLVCVGVTLGLQGLGYEIDKAYLYLPFMFAVLVELLQMRHHSKQKRF